MAWTTPTVRATGYLVTASDWNTDIVNNLAYLKGEAGLNIELEDDVVPSAGTERLGLSTAPWDEGHFDKLFAGPRCALHKFVREIVLNWEDDALSNYQLSGTTGGAGASISDGGLGQVVIEVTNNQAGSGYLKGNDEQNSALDTSFNASRSPYYRQEFAVDSNVADTDIFMGLRQTPSDVVPVYTENHIGLIWTGAEWQFRSANGSNLDGHKVTINANTRYVIELLLVSGSSVEVYLNGVLVDTLDYPATGALKWSLLLASDGGGGATTTHLTIGKTILQEDLS